MSYFNKMPQKIDLRKQRLSFAYGFGGQNHELVEHNEKHSDMVEYICRVALLALCLGCENRNGTP